MMNARHPARAAALPVPAVIVLVTIGLAVLWLGGFVRGAGTEMLAEGLVVATVAVAVSLGCAAVVMKIGYGDVLSPPMAPRRYAARHRSGPTAWLDLGRGGRVNPGYGTLPTQRGPNGRRAPDGRDPAPRWPHAGSGRSDAASRWSDAASRWPDAGSGWPDASRRGWGNPN